MRGTSEQFLLILGILIAVLAIAFGTRLVGGQDSPEVEALRLAHSIAIHINALSSMESGRVMISSDKQFTVYLEKNNPKSIFVTVSGGTVTDVRFLWEGMQEAQITRMLVKEGDSVSSGKTIAEVTAKGVVNQVKSDAGGIVARIYRKEGDSIRTGDPIVGVRNSLRGEATRSAFVLAYGDLLSPTNEQRAPQEFRIEDVGRVCVVKSDARQVAEVVTC